MQQQHPGNNPSASTAHEPNLTIRAQTGMAGLLTRKRDPGRWLRTFFVEVLARQRKSWRERRTGGFKRESNSRRFAPRARDCETRTGIAAQTATRRRRHLRNDVQANFKLWEGWNQEETERRREAKRRANSRIS